MRNRYRAIPRASGSWEVRDDHTGKMYSYHRGIGCGDMAVKIADDMNAKYRKIHELSRTTKP